MRGSVTSRSNDRPISCRRSSSILSVRCVIESRYSGSTGRPAHHLLGEAFDDVALDQVVGPGQADAALEVCGDFADIVREASKAFDPVRVDDLAATPDASVATTDDAAVGDVATGDDCDLADLEELSDLRSPLHPLAPAR